MVGALGLGGGDGGCGRLATLFGFGAEEGEHGDDVTVGGKMEVDGATYIYKGASHNNRLWELAQTAQLPRRRVTGSECDRCSPMWTAFPPYGIHLHLGKLL